MTQFSPIRPYLLRIPLTPNSANRCNIVFRGAFQIEVMPSDLSICLYLYLFISVCTYQFVSVHMCICAHCTHCISSCVCVCIWSACYDVIIFVQFVWGYGCLFFLNAIVILPDGECPPVSLITECPSSYVFPATGPFLPAQSCSGLTLCSPLMTCLCHGSSASQWNMQVASAHFLLWPLTDHSPTSDSFKLEVS